MGGGSAIRGRGETEGSLGWGFRSARRLSVLEEGEGLFGRPACLAGRLHPGEFSAGSLPTSTPAAPKFCLTLPGTVLRGPSQSRVPSVRA